jgi:hypothetical protein
MLGVTPILQSHLMEEHKMGITSSGAAASLVGGVIAAVLTCPADVVNTCAKGDLDQKKYKGVTDIVRLLWKESGYTRFFAGVGWRIANITGTILIVNECRMRLAPIIFPE